MRPPALPRAKSDLQSAGLPHTTTLTAATSFESTVSTEPPRIFSQPDFQGNTSSNETSFNEEDFAQTQALSQDSFSCSQTTAEALNRSFHEAADLICVDVLPKADIGSSNAKILSNPTPTTKGPLFGSSLPFRYRYELTRISKSSGLDVSDLMTGITSCADDYSKIWKTFADLAKVTSATLPEKSNAEAWNSAIGTYQAPSGKHSVILSGRLEWRSPGSSHLFDVQLNPLKLAESCRFHRKYGSDRFMTLSLPSLTQSAPSHLKRDQISLQKEVAKWLGTSSHNIADRTWRAYYIEPVKLGKKRKRRNRATYLDSTDQDDGKGTTDAPGYKVYLFAIDGYDFSYSRVPIFKPPSSATRQPISIGDFLSWHIPVLENMGSTDCKVFQRFALGLSQTIPSVVLQTYEFAYLPDTRNQHHGKVGMVMNDGCARISRSLAKEIALSLGLDDIPAVFQARIAGAKGLWMVDHDEILQAKYPEQMALRNFCIEINDSQLKIHPHPKNDTRRDEVQRTFEVVDYSVPPHVASLNVQIMTILYDRGVPRDVLKEMLLADSAVYHKDLFNAMDNRLLLRDWIGVHKLSPRGTDGIQYRGEWPVEPDEQVILLLESGFTPQDCPILHERLGSCLERNLDRYIEKMQIRVPLSTYLYCIPDPYGILAPDEVHVGFSETWTDSVSGFSDTILDGIDVLIGRLPALLPSDIQRRKAAWKKELRHFKDVVVFSTQGDVPLADMLSGGDYDGDMPWLCWHPSLVDAFTNAGVPEDRPSEEQCGLEKKSVPLSKIFTIQGQSDFAAEVDQFFGNCFEFNLNMSFLGVATLEHEKVTYDKASLSCQEAIRLATLASYLVDSSKQGLLLTETNWHRFRGQVSKRGRQPPAYKDVNSERRMKESNIVDYLKFWVARPEKEKILKLFHNSWPRMLSQENDAILRAPWLQTQRNCSAALKADLEMLERRLGKLKDEWIRHVPKGSDGDAKPGTSNFPQTVKLLYDQICSIEPPDGKHDFSVRWESEREEEFSHWRTLRASCLFAKSRGQGTIFWYLAGEQLCHLKVKAAGRSRTVLYDIYKVYKPDKKVIKRVTKQLEDNDDDDIDGDIAGDL